MNKPSVVPVIAQIQNAEKRYYVALQQYDTALSSTTNAEILARRRQALCDAFEELSAAHALLALECDEPTPPQVP